MLTIALTVLVVWFAVALLALPVLVVLGRAAGWADGDAELQRDELLAPPRERGPRPSPRATRGAAVS